MTPKQLEDIADRLGALRNLGTIGGEGIARSQIKERLLYTDLPLLIIEVDRQAAEKARVTGERDDALIAIRALVGHPEPVAEGPVPLPGSQPVFCVPCMDLLPQGKLLAHRETDEHKAKVEAYREYKTAQAAADGLSSTDDEQVPDGCVCGIVGTHPPCVWCETNATGAVNRG